MNELVNMWPVFTGIALASAQWAVAMHRIKWLEKQLDSMDRKLDNIFAPPYRRLYEEREKKRTALDNLGGDDLK